MDAKGNEHPFVCMASSLNPIIFPNAVSVSVNGVNDRGQIVGTGRSPNGDYHAYLLTPEPAPDAPPAVAASRCHLPRRIAPSYSLDGAFTGRGRSRSR
jgi:probable HAF family extracellular repeat protein